MNSSELDSLKDISEISLEEGRLFSASHEEILSGWTTDVYFVKTRDVLRRCNRLDTPVVAEFFARDQGIFAGLPEVLKLLSGRPLYIEAIPEGTRFSSKQVVLRITGSYSDFGMYETVVLGMLASSSGWATAARECVEAASGKPVLCFGARHVHPAVAPVMERAAVAVGGCSAASCILGAKFAGGEPKGTIPHAAILVVGDTLELAKVYDSFLPSGEARIILVDTFKDEAEETLRVARALGPKLQGVRLDTPGERGGVTVELVREVRWRLDMEGFNKVQIIASGGLNPERIHVLAQAGVDAFGVGSYIAHGTPRDMTMDIKEVEGRPVAKRGRLPGKLDNPSLQKLEL
ncbi:MAG TPA: nicotinate phosphoribosyltransferase [Synergistales bacterium]|nr:nicotinate phosphoribosyltransferase [Synergistales bacterium]